MTVFRRAMPPPRLMGNDLVVNEDACNLACTYCLTGQSNLKAGHRDQLIFQPPRVDRYAPGSPLGQRLHTVVERIRTSLRTPLLKVTGGEIFLIKGIIEFLEAVAPLHEVLVVQSNGLPLIDERIARLAALGNVVVQISLDSSVYAGNGYRARSEDLHGKMLDRIAAVVAAGLPLEIYAVLNDRSAPYVEDFARWCGAFPRNRPQFFPFPVRGPDAARFAMKPEDVRYLDALRALQPELPDVLPPPAYLDRLVDFFRHGRTWRCHLPALVISTFDDGLATACPNIWFNDMGNLLEDGWETVVGQVGATGFYELLLAERPRLDACKRCFTPWDTLSLYFEDEISLDDLCRAPSYGAPGVRALLAEKKAAYDAARAVPAPVAGRS